MIEAKLDTSRFDRAFALYEQTSRKTLAEAINYKLFDAARAAIKGTDKADRNDIQQTLEEASTLYPKRTVAEMIVIMKHARTGDEIGDLLAEAKELIKYRKSHTGFVKSGWIPALRKLLRMVGKESISISSVTSQENNFGGAEPAKASDNVLNGSVFNDIHGIDNKAFVERLKEKGAQFAIDKVTADIETYLAKKLDIPIEQFNKA